MRPAPAVAIQLPRDPGWAVAAAMLGALAAGGAGALLGAHLELPMAHTLWVVLASACGGGALSLRFLPGSAGRLRWDGDQHWWFSPAADGSGERSGQLAVTLDLDGWLLLRFHPAEGAGGRASWLPLREAGLGSAAQALRAAVYSRRFTPDDQLPRRGPEPE
jgi:hypothetical protein